MAIQLKQSLNLSQQLVMTPQLQQAIKLLQLSRLELADTICQELEENPTLEVREDISDNNSPEQTEETTTTESSAEKEVTVEEKFNDDIDWGNYLNEYNSSGKVSFENEARDAPRFEAFIAQKESLIDHLHWQLMMIVPSEKERSIGSLIIGNINANGYLDVSVEELACQSNASPQKVQRVLSMMQTFDPVGICAKDIRECLLIQTRHLGFDESSLVAEIIREHLGHLENKNYSAICSALNTHMDDVLAAVEIITGMDPMPGQIFRHEDSQYVEPDIYVHKVGDEFVIQSNDDGMPRLRISPFYRNAVGEDGKLADSAKDYVQEKLRSAAWLIRSIHQRQRTIYRVMESIVKFQGEFFEKGLTHLKPMVLKDVATDVNMHESTVSRVTTNKYAYTPQGVFELKYFFNSSVSRTRGGAIASASVLAKIKKIIKNEDPGMPRSDEKISEILAEEANISIARRTVAKYRETLKILPSNKRRQP